MKSYNVPVVEVSVLRFQKVLHGLGAVSDDEGEVRGRRRREGRGAVVLVPRHPSVVFRRGEADVSVTVGQEQALTQQDIASAAAAAVAVISV